MRRFFFGIAIVVLTISYGIPRILRRKYAIHPQGGAILISGASSGIGRHAAVSLAQSDASLLVFAGVRRNIDAESILKENLDNLRPILLDVTDVDRIEIAKETILAEMRQREVKDFVGLINNAGIGKELPLEVQRIESMRKVFDVNVFGVVSLTQAFVPFLRKSQGRIVNVGSVAGKVVAPMKGTYAASKHALEALNDAMRVELGHWGISVSLIQPAYVKTRIAAKQTGKNAVFRSLPTHERELYAHIFDTFEARRLRAESRADSPQVTTDAIRHALTSEYPKTRYAVANAHGVPASLFLSLLPFVPDRLMDRFRGA